MVPRSLSAFPLFRFPRFLFQLLNLVGLASGGESNRAGQVPARFHKIGWKWRGSGIPRTGRWRRGADMAVPRNDHAVALLLTAAPSAVGGTGRFTVQGTPGLCRMRSVTHGLTTDQRYLQPFLLRETSPRSYEFSPHSSWALVRTQPIHDRRIAGLPGGRKRTVLSCQRVGHEFIKDRDAPRFPAGFHHVIGAGCSRPMPGSILATCF